MNKASGGDGISVELFQILKDDAVKVLHSICQQIWKTQQWPEEWKRSVFIPIPKKGNAKECSPSPPRAARFRPGPAGLPARLEFPRETGLILRCAGKAGNPFQTTQGNRLPADSLI